MKRVVRRPAILLLSVLTTLLLPPAVARGQDWTLSECIEQALRTSPQIQATAAERDAAAENLQEARASRYPLVGLTASTSYLTETMSLALPGMDSTPGRRIQFGDGSTSDLMLGAHVPLFTGGALAATLQERAAGYQARTMDLRADTLAVRTQVRQAFFLALGLQEQATAIRQGQLRLERRVQEISHDIDAGLATEAMRLEALSRLRKAEQATLQADADAAGSTSVGSSATAARRSSQTAIWADPCLPATRPRFRWPCARRSGRWRPVPSPWSTPPGRCKAPSGPP
jgi:hypothetical protein